MQHYPLWTCRYTYDTDTLVAAVIRPLIATAMLSSSRIRLSTARLCSTRELRRSCSTGAVPKHSKYVDPCISRRLGTSCTQTRTPHATLPPPIAQLSGLGRDHDTEEVAAGILQKPGNLLHIASAGRGLVRSAIGSPVARVGPVGSSSNVNLCLEVKLEV